MFNSCSTFSMCCTLSSCCTHMHFSYLRATFYWEAVYHLNGWGVGVTLELKAFGAVQLNINTYYNFVFLKQKSQSIQSFWKKLNFIWNLIYGPISGFSPPPNIAKFGGCVVSTLFKTTFCWKLLVGLGLWRANFVCWSWWNGHLGWHVYAVLFIAHFYKRYVLVLKSI